MAGYELFCNPWEELERPSKRRRIEISRLAKLFIKVFKLQKSKKYSKLRYDEKTFFIVVFFLPTHHDYHSKKNVKHL